MTVSLNPSWVRHTSTVIGFKIDFSFEMSCARPPLPLPAASPFRAVWFHIFTTTEAFPALFLLIPHTERLHSDLGSDQTISHSNGRDLHLHPSSGWLRKVSEKSLRFWNSVLLWTKEKGELLDEAACRSAHLTVPSHASTECLPLAATQDRPVSLTW